MEAGCGLLVGGDEARSEVKPASRASLGNAAAADVAAGAASVPTCASSWRTVGAASASPPSRCASRLRSSTAPSESSPASISGMSAPTSSPITSETTARTASRSASTLVGGAHAAGSSAAPWSIAVSCMSSGPFGGGAEALVHGGVVEDQRLGQRCLGVAAQPLRQPAAQLHRAQRVEPRLHQRRVGAHVPADHLGDHRAHRDASIGWWQCGHASVSGWLRGGRELRQCWCVRRARCDGVDLQDELHRAQREWSELDKLVSAPAERVHAAEAVRGKAAADGGEVRGCVAHARVEARGQRGVDGARAARAQREHAGRCARAVREDADGRAALGRVVQQQRRQVDVGRRRVHRTDAGREHERWCHLPLEACSHLSRIGRRPCARCVASRVARRVARRVATMRAGERVLEGVAHELGARAEVEDQVVVRVHPRALTR
eukprot:scaffold9527_cov75-Phaeocystis_antarctica.AAC.2